MPTTAKAFQKIVFHFQMWNSLPLRNSNMEVEGGTHYDPILALINDPSDHEVIL
jgi:hypothetical protein